jgi:phenylpropionate dioxygenase-like ring-hydroxylating dioxygenase large terminal subunit
VSAATATLTTSPVLRDREGKPVDPVLRDDWHVVGPAARLRDGVDPLPIGGRTTTRLLNVDLLLWRPDEQVRVWRDLCIHRGYELSRGKYFTQTVDGAEVPVIECGYHGYTYGPDGRCLFIPAGPEERIPETIGAHTFRVQERYGWLWACLGEPKHDIPLFPEWEDPSYRKIFCGPYDGEASAPRFVEIFLDVAHFPFVHEGRLGVRAHTDIADYEVRLTADGVEAIGIRVFQPDQDGRGTAGYVTYDYRAMRPLCAYFIKRGERSFAIYYAVTPVEENRSRNWMWIAMNYGWEEPEEAIRVFQDELMAEDTAIVEHQHPNRLPRDLQAEFHHRADRASIRYRQWINALGLTFGTE